MKRWVTVLQNKAEVPEVDAFLADIEAVCRKHKMVLGHQDGQGAFLVESIEENEWIIDWMKDANDARSVR